MGKSLQSGRLVSNSHIFVNSGGLVGIGTNNPDTKLTVKAGSGDQLRLDNAGERYTQISLRNNGTQKAALWLDETTDQFDLFAASGYGMRLLTGGTERLRITSAGSVGINTDVGASVGLNLHQISGAAAQVRFQGSATGTGEGDGFGLGNSGTVDAYVWNYEAGHIQFATSNSPRLTITSVGRMLLGTTTEGHESADDFTVSDSGDVGITIRSTDSNQTQISFSDATSGTGEYAGQISYFHTDNYMRFRTNSEERLRITSAGLVGIGTDNPTLTAGNGVHIAGGNAALKLQNTNNGDWAFIEYADESNTTKYIQGYRDSSGVYAIRPGTSLNATPGISLTSAGNIGINRTDPDQKLNVSGCAEFNAYDSASGSGGYYTSKGLIIGNLYDAGKSYSGSDDRTACIWQERGLDVDFATNDALRMKITYDGLVGIGTDNPSKTLTVYGDSSSSFRISKSGVLAYDHTFDGSSYTIANNNGSAGIPIIIGTKTAGGESLRITSAGELFVGGSSTYNVIANYVNTAKLHLSGAGGGSANIELYGSGHATDPKIMTVSTSSTERLRITSGTAIIATKSANFYSRQFNFNTSSDSNNVQYNVYTVGDLSAAGTRPGYNHEPGMWMVLGSVPCDNTYRTVLTSIRDATGMFHGYCGDASSRNIYQYQYNFTSPGYNVNILSQRFNNGAWNTGSVSFQIVTNGSSYDLQMKATSYYNSANNASFRITFHTYY